MKKGKTKEQTSHDRKVSRLATRLEKEGYRVKASVGRRPSPDPIGRSKRIPDITATKRGKTKVIEVETPRSLKSDKSQLTTFARHAASKKNVSFDIVVTRPRRKNTQKSASNTGTAKKR